jgi:EGF domain-containing protein
MRRRCRKRQWIILPILLLVRLGLAGCSGTSAGPDVISCYIDDDCPPEMYCLGGTCEPYPDAEGCIDVADGVECGTRYCNGLEWRKLTCKYHACSGSELIEDCDDGQECTADQCAAESGCDNQPESAGTPCGDQGLACRVDDTCDAEGNCVDNGLSTDHSACPECQICQAGDCVPQNGEDTKGDCNGHGVCNPDGTCQCNAEYAGMHCEMCNEPDDYWGYPDCNNDPVSGSCQCELQDKDWAMCDGRICRVVIDNTAGCAGATGSSCRACTQDITCSSCYIFCDCRVSSGENESISKSCGGGQTSTSTCQHGGYTWTWSAWSTCQ